MRITLLAAALLVASAAHAASVRFVSPQAGSQALGPLAIEVATDAQRIDRVDFFVDGVLAGVARTPPWRIAFDFGTSVDARTVMAKVWSDGYRNSETASVLTAGLVASDSMTVDVVEVPLRVRSRGTLRASDLDVRENGVRQEIRDVRAERPPAHFAFVVDRSLSMGDGRLAAALEAIESGLRQLRPGDTASLVLFNQNVGKAQSIAAGDALAHTSSGIVPSGGTSLRDALASISSHDRTYAIAITDGGDRNSELDEESALRAISGTKTVVTGIVLGASHTRFLDIAAEKTGGSVVAASRDSVGAAVSSVLADINSRYLVVYQSAGTKRGWRSIQVKPRRGGVEIVTARKGYFAE